MLFLILTTGCYNPVDVRLALNAAAAARLIFFGSKGPTRPFVAQFHYDPVQLSPADVSGPV
jgi:hypothetical protein